MTSRIRTAGLAAAALTFACCSQAPPPEAKKGRPAVDKQAYGKMPDGTQIDIYTLANANGMEARIITYGGIVTSLRVPDRAGKLDDVVLGMDNLDGYRGDGAHLGALIGRYGNRIGGGKFKLDGKTMNVTQNENANTLHGGAQGFDKRVWTANVNGDNLELTYLSKDGEEGFPGNLTAKVVYSVTDQNELKIDYSATTDKPTVANLTNHSYFNLAGQGNGDILQDQLTIDADRFTPVKAGLITTGELKPVEGTPFDFRKATAIGARINQDDPQLKIAKGYDQNWVLNKAAGTLGKAAEVYEPTTGRVMEVFTTEPGLQFYTGNFLDGTIHGKGGKVYPIHSALCLETQHYPDSPNQPSFPSTELKPGETYHTTTLYKFSAR